MNSYCALGEIKTRLGITGDSDNEYMMVLIESASRAVEQMAGRVFWTEQRSRYFDGGSRTRLVIPDALAVSLLATDGDRDETWGDEWTEGTNYTTQPEHRLPYTHIERVVGDSSEFSLGGGRRWVKITATWGAGDMKSANPWAASGETGTVATSDGTTLTLSAGTNVYAGQTLLLGSEQVYVSAISGASATVVRGVNNTDAAAHSGADVYTAQYPAVVRRAALMIAQDFHQEAGRLGFESERMGDYSYKVAGAVKKAEQYYRLLSCVRREPWM